MNKKTPFLPGTVEAVPKTLSYHSLQNFNRMGFPMVSKLGPWKAMGSSRSQIVGTMGGRSGATVSGLNCAKGDLTAAFVHFSTCFQWIFDAFRRFSMLFDGFTALFRAPDTMRPDSNGSTDSLGGAVARKAASVESIT